MRAVMTPLAVSILRERGTTSRRRRSWTFSEVSSERMNGGLDSGTVSDSLIESDGLAGLLAIKEVGDKFDDTGDTNGRTDENDFANTSLADLGVAEIFSTGSRVEWEESWQSFSKRARVSEV